MKRRKSLSICKRPREEGPRTPGGGPCKGPETPRFGAGGCSGRDGESTLRKKREQKQDFYTLHFCVSKGALRCEGGP